MPTIEDGRNAIEQGNLQQARLIFEAILQDTPRSEQAWLGLAEVLTESKDKRVCYENVLKINKDNREAREGLRNLEPQANPFVEALQPAKPPGGDSADDATMVSQKLRATTDTADEEFDQADGPPSYALVALGLLLSVVVFALGGGAVFYLLSSITAP